MAKPYFNPGNPFDKGLPGQENSEQLTRYLAAGRQDELKAMGWDPKAPLKWHDNPASPDYRKPGTAGAVGGGGNAIPGGSMYAQAALMAKNKYQSRLADINYQRQGVFRQTGFKGKINAETGVVSELGVDPTSQYGQFQQLNRQQAGEGYQIEDFNIGRGLGSSRQGGLAAQNLGEARYGWGQQDAAFGADLNDRLHGLLREQQGAKYDYDAALWEAQRMAALEAIQNGDYYPWDDGGDDGDGGEEDDPNNHLWAPDERFGKEFRKLDKYIANRFVKAQRQASVARKPSTSLTPAKVKALNMAAAKKAPVRTPHQTVTAAKAKALNKANKKGGRR